MRPSLLALLLALPAPAIAADPPGSEAAREPSRAYHLTPGADGVDCNLRVGPNDRVAQDGDLVVPAGATVEVAAALRGSVVVKRGARVRKAVAVGGGVRVEDGGVVEKEAVAISGDVEVQPGGRVGGDAVSLGGRVLVRQGAQVAGDLTSLSLQLGGFNLAQALLDGLVMKGPCKVEVDRGPK